jgi:hypothetical protein
MKRAPPFLALWCLSRLSGTRNEALVGDLVERFAEGETPVWFWRQTLMTLASTFGREARQHGLSFLRALAAAAVVLLLMWNLEPLLTNKILHFETHALFEWDPLWLHHRGWKVAFLTLQALHVGMWFAAIGWLAPRIHRAHPRLIVTVCAIVVFALYLPELTRQVDNLMEHPRYWGAFKLVCARVLISLGALLLSGWWSARRIPDPA